MSVTGRPALIAMLSAFGERGIRGRTVLQKNAYFLGVLTENDFEHRPHYYGPYSSAVEYEMGTLVGLDFVGESQNSVMGFDGRKYVRYDYRLTDDGKEAASQMSERHSESWGELVEASNRLKRIGAGAQALQVAAKVHYLVMKAGSKLDISEVRSRAGDLGWEVTDEMVDAASEMVERLLVADRSEAED